MASVGIDAFCWWPVFKRPLVAGFERPLTPIISSDILAIDVYVHRTSPLPDLTVSMLVDSSANESRVFDDNIERFVNVLMIEFSRYFGTCELPFGLETPKDASEFQSNGMRAKHRIEIFRSASKKTLV